MVWLKVVGFDDGIFKSRWKALEKGMLMNFKYLALKTLNNNMKKGQNSQNIARK